MYALEGIVMVALMFWGIILIYRSLISRFKLKRQQTNFLLSVTHELKTPLASIKLYLETLKKRQVDEASRVQIIGNSLEDVDRLAALVNNMLLASQLENKGYEPRLVKLNLSELVSTTIQRFTAPRNMTERISTNIQPGVSVVADEEAMTMVLNNLLSNASKYSPPGSTIEVTLNREADSVVMKFCNEGPGISDEDKPFVFEPFYRSGDENTRRSKGTGLGLFIVCNLLSLQHARIDVKDKKPSGVVFTITFEKNAA
jgi:signal transduction histidine kinase